MVRCANSISTLHIHAINRTTFFISNFLFWFPNKAAISARTFLRLVTLLLKREFRHFKPGYMIPVFNTGK